MARPAERFIKELSSSQRKQLPLIWRTGESHRLRSRAHALLLSDKKWLVTDIAQVFQVTGQTVYSWLERWESNDDLEEAPRSGAIPELDADQKKTALEELGKHAYNPRGAIDSIEMRTGKRVSLDILRRLAKKSALLWKRMRGSLHDRRDDEAFHLAKTEIAEFSRMASQSDFNFWFFDEASFSLTPSIPYAWQRIGETIEIPFQREKLLSAMGFIDLDSNFFSFEVESTVNSEVAFAVMDKFASHLKGTNVVIIDNAPAHRGDIFQARVPVWNAQDLHFYSCRRIHRN